MEPFLRFARNLYRPLKDYDINDFVIPLTINLQGYRGVLEKKAICYEKDAGGTKGEFFRQVRITNRTIRAIINHRQLLNPLKFGFLVIRAFSHKLCKFFVPFFLITLLGANLLLANKEKLLFDSINGSNVFLWWGQYRHSLANIRIIDRFSGAARLFVIVNAAILLAWMKFLQGETYITWSPTKR